jgi:hypothetical protein
MLHLCSKYAMIKYSTTTGQAEMPWVGSHTIDCADRREQGRQPSHRLGVFESHLEVSLFFPIPPAYTRNQT